MADEKQTSPATEKPGQDSSKSSNKSTGKTGSSKQSLEAWAVELNTPPWLLAAARVKNVWIAGRPMSKSEYQQGLKATEQEEVG